MNEIYLGIGTAFLSFIGALAGVYLSSRFDQSNWEKRFELEQRRIVLEKRASLIERTVVLFNKVPTIVGLRGTLDAEKQQLLLDMICAADRHRSSGCSSAPSIDPMRIEATAKEIHDLNAEFAAVMSMDVIYFGPETARAVRSFGTSDPWTEPEARRQALVNAMGKELSWFPSKL